MRLLKVAFVFLLVLVAFAGGYVMRARKTVQPAASGTQERKVLYWVDPMHPAYKSDKPGIAPDCGMALEPVYADEGAQPAAATARKPLYYRDPKDPKYTATT